MRVQAPESSGAFDYLEWTLGEMDFFRANDYQVSLPDHPLLNGEADSAGSREERRSVFVEEVYRASEFDAALAELGGQRDELRTAVERIATWGAHDGFASHDSLTVTLTLYGPGGSYDPYAGDIILWTDTEGSFNGGSGVGVVVHEMVHIAVDDGIAQPLGLEHWERERLVDLLVRREFADLLPDYRLQRGGTAPIDRFVLGTDLEGLRGAVARYVRTARQG